MVEIITKRTDKDRFDLVDPIAETMTILIKSYMAVLTTLTGEAMERTTDEQLQSVLANIVQEKEFIKKHTGIEVPEC